MTALRQIAAAFALLVACLAPLSGNAQVSGVIEAARVKSVTIELHEGALIRMDRAASSIFIANPAIADVTVKSTRLVYLFGKTAGETTLFAVDSAENVLVNLRVIVHHNLSRMRESMARLVPNGSVQVASIDRGVVLTGSVPTATDAENARRIAMRFIGEGEEVINRLEVTEPNQVNLRVRIAEVSREVLNQMGINWDVFVSGTLNGAFSSLNPTAGVNDFLLGYNEGDVDLNVLVDLLAQDGALTVLAEPNLTALSGETASFLAGGEFPIPIARDENEVTIEFKQFGVSLSFTPTVLSDERISMRVRPEVSQLSSAGAIELAEFQIPALTTRRAETTIELGSGQSFAIAGLLLDNTQHDVSKIPGLGDIPILGTLFRSKRFERDETELVIIVTPYLVRPVSDPVESIPLPTDPYMMARPMAQQQGAGVPVTADKAPPPVVPETPLASLPVAPQILPPSSAAKGNGAEGGSGGGFIVE
ncbi:MAG: type II and III secretion system protein family protein [Kiloniellales bacterium]